MPDDAKMPKRPANGGLRPLSRLTPRFDYPSVAVQRVEARSQHDGCPPFGIFAPSGFRVVGFRALSPSERRPIEFRYETQPFSRIDCL